MADAFLVYERLWRRAQDDGIFVRYDGWPDKSLAGYFHPHNDEEPERNPEIAIRRPYFIEPDDEPRRESNAPSHHPQPNIEAELFTLAHEYGHACSFAGRTEAAEYKLYEAAAKHRDRVTEDESKRLPSGLSMLEWNEQLRRAVYDRLDEDACTRIMREESLAWKIGREVLDELGFTDLAVYDAYATKRLHNHRYRLGIEDLWPGDVLGEMSNE
jgi:hypothetical protein